MKVKMYACINKNEEIRMISSSGGVYYLLAQSIIQSGGVVYGACYEGVDVCHIRIECESDINLTCGSKYIPSQLRNTFKMVKEDLQTGRKVLFTGTPCQCAGLLKFAGNYENLVCVDCVCHGIPSKKAWHEYLYSLSKQGKKVISVSMRDKCSGWSDYSCSFFCDDGSVIYESKNNNAFMKGFLADLYLRPSCYQCSFKGLDRKTDLTLGDYWGIWNLQPEMNDDKGTSLVFIHTQKGMQLFKRISDSLVYIQAFDAAIIHNPSIITSAYLTDKREIFFRRMEMGEDFISIVEDLTKQSFSDRVKRKLKSFLR